MKSKIIENVNENKPLAEQRQLGYLDEIFKFVDSGEMQKHLFEWLTHGRDRHELNCAAIICHAPAQLEHKLQSLKLLVKDYKFEGLGRYIGEIEDILADCHDSHTGMGFELHMYDRLTPKTCQSFGEAVAHLKEVRKSGDVLDNITDSRLRYGQTNIIKIIYEGYEPTYIFLNDGGEALYYDASPNKHVKMPGKFQFCVPFQPGDVVTTDCRPFSPPKKILILENDDTFDRIDFHGVTCLFVNEYEKLDIGYFKYNEFLKHPIRNHVSAMYRAETYTGELTKTDSPMGVLAKKIKKNPELGRRLYRYISRYSVNNLRSCECPHIGAYGVEWGRLEQMLSV